MFSKTPLKISGLLKKYLKKLIWLFGSFAIASATFANPIGGVVTSGSASIHQAPGVTRIQQGSQQAIIHWQTFNIKGKEKTQFIQPNKSSVVLNRINPKNGASQIFGQLTANGKIILVNQAGIFLVRPPK